MGKIFFPVGQILFPSWGVFFGKNIKVGVELKNAAGTTLKTLSFENVHMKTNYVTEYKGALYDMSGTADFTFSDGDFIDSGTGKTFGE